MAAASGGVTNGGPDRFGCPAERATARDAATVASAVFIDCSYEGDLMVRAGMSITFGRESTDEYGESLAGVRPPLARYAAATPTIRTATMPPGDGSGGSTKTFSAASPTFSAPTQPPRPTKRPRPSRTASSRGFLTTRAAGRTRCTSGKPGE